MQWWQFALAGAAGGILAEFMALFKDVAAWQSSRRQPSGKLAADPAALRTWVDVPAHAWMLVMRAPIGAASAGVFAAADQLKGLFAALVLGYCGPLAGTRLGQLSLVDSLLNGTTPAPTRVLAEPGGADPESNGIAPAARQVAEPERPEVVREH